MTIGYIRVHRITVENFAPLLKRPLNCHAYYKWHRVCALYADLHWDPWSGNYTVLDWNSILRYVHHCFGGKFSAFDHHQI